MVEQEQQTPQRQPGRPQAANRHWLALVGAPWPTELACFGNPLAKLLAARKRLERCPLAEVWIGYSSPLALLQASTPIDLASLLDQWCDQATQALVLRQSHPERCHLLNLSLLDPDSLQELLQRAQEEDHDNDDVDDAIDATLAVLNEPEVAVPREGQMPVDPKLDPRLTLVLLHHPKLANLYADLEGCCTLLGRNPQFRLPLETLRGSQLAERCLQSWRREQSERHQAHANCNGQLDQLREAHQQELAALQGQHQEELLTLRQQLDESRASAQALIEAREEAELTLLQLHQVQEELEHYFLEHRKQTEANAQLESELIALREEALHLFLHSTPSNSLESARLSQLSRLAREALQLNRE